MAVVSCANAQLQVWATALLWDVGIRNAWYFLSRLHFPQFPTGRKNAICEQILLLTENRNLGYLIQASYRIEVARYYLKILVVVLGQWASVIWECPALCSKRTSAQNPPNCDGASLPVGRTLGSWLKVFPSCSNRRHRAPCSSRQQVGGDHTYAFMFGKVGYGGLLLRNIHNKTNR